jgi:hypothetical protein
MDPARFIEGDERDRAVAALRKYFSSYTGSRFEVLADHDSPNEFTARDFVAVSTLSVNVPSAAVIWLLEDGLEQVRELLAKIPGDVRIWDDDADLSPDGAAWQLWALVRRHRWPEGKVPASGIGPTKASKLLAAKRPHLVPVYDAYVAGALLDDPSDDYWSVWQERLRGDSGRALRDACDELKSEAGVPHSVSVLRVLDVAIWMRVHGARADAPAFWSTD